MFNGFKTSEFITVAAFCIAEVAQSLTDANIFAGKWAQIGVAVAVAGYALSRGIKKAGTGGR